MGRIFIELAGVQLISYRVTTTRSSFLFFRSVPFTLENRAGENPMLYSIFLDLVYLVRQTKHQYQKHNQTSLAIVFALLYLRFALWWLDLNLLSGPDALEKVA